MQNKRAAGPGDSLQTGLLQGPTLLEILDTFMVFCYGFLRKAVSPKTVRDRARAPERMTFEPPRFTKYSRSLVQDAMKPKQAL